MSSIGQQVEPDRRRRRRRSAAPTPRAAVVVARTARGSRRASRASTGWSGRAARGTGTSGWSVIHADGVDIRRAAGCVDEALAEQSRARSGRVGEPLSSRAPGRGCPAATARYQCSRNSVVSAAGRRAARSVPSLDLAVDEVEPDGRRRRRRRRGGRRGSRRGSRRPRRSRGLARSRAGSAGSRCARRRGASARASCEEADVTT